MTTRATDIEGNKKYRHLLTLSYDEILPFIFVYLKKCTLPVIIAGLILILSFIPLIIFRIWIANHFEWYSIVLHSLAGIFLFPLVLIIPHELLHIIPYYLSGARDIRIGANWNEAYFYVTAHNHPINVSWFTFIAITPAIVITVLLILLITILPALWQWTTAVAIFMHLTMCAGDIALLSFLYLNRGKGIMTWDDAVEKKALFYEEVN